MVRADGALGKAHELLRITLLGNRVNSLVLCGLVTLLQRPTG
jgi:hypothetical protein